MDIASLVSNPIYTKSTSTKSTPKSGNRNVSSRAFRSKKKKTGTISLLTRAIEAVQQSKHEINSDTATTLLRSIDNGSSSSAASSSSSKVVSGSSSKVVSGSSSSAVSGSNNDDSNNENDWSDEKRAVINNLRHQGYGLRFVDDHWKNDRDCVLTAVSSCGTVLELAPPSLKADREIVEAALHNDWRALEYADEKFREDPKFVLSVIKKEREAELNEITEGKKEIFVSDSKLETAMEEKEESISEKEAEAEKEKQTCEKEREAEKEEEKEEELTYEKEVEAEKKEEKEEEPICEKGVETEKEEEEEEPTTEKEVEAVKAGEEEEEEPTSEKEVEAEKEEEATSEKEVEAEEEPTSEKEMEAEREEEEECIQNNSYSSNREVDVGSEDKSYSEEVDDGSDDDNNDEEKDNGSDDKDEEKKPSPSKVLMRISHRGLNFLSSRLKDEMNKGFLDGSYGRMTEEYMIENHPDWSAEKRKMMIEFAADLIKTEPDFILRVITAEYNKNGDAGKNDEKEEDLTNM